MAFILGTIFFYKINSLRNYIYSNFVNLPDCMKTIKYRFFPQIGKIFSSAKFLKIVSKFDVLKAQIRRLINTVTIIK